MTSDLSTWKIQLQTILADFSDQVVLTDKHVLVIGCSTSEVIGKKIGTAGTNEVAELIFSNLREFSQQTGVALAFQCCEHLNRALVVERATADQKGWEEVSVVPVRQAGGAMATYAYNHFSEPVVVEFIQADAGMDIGDTFIGMHIKHVAVPVRASISELGSAHVTMARTRPKLIGGARAIYEHSMGNESCS